MTLELDFALRRGGLDLRVALAVPAGTTVAVVGPNGAGKSTLLQAVAGLLPIDAGRIACMGEVWDDGRVASRRPPEQRRAGMVFQEHRLFPHLDVLDNTAFGLRARGVPRAAARRAAHEWLQRVGLEALAGRRPATLSGGEAQRIALARALCAEPRLLLLDEPLAAVDASARLRLRRELLAHLGGFAGPRLLVAHDAIDAFALADTIAVLEAGRIVQTGPVAAICSQPRSRYVADLVGVNLFRGQCHAGVLVLPEGGQLVVGGDAPAGAVLATVHPRAVALYRVRPDGTPRNVFAAGIAGIEAAGDRVRVRLDGAVPLVAEVTPAAVRDLQLGIGGQVWVALKATEIAVFAA